MPEIRQTPSSFPIPAAITLETTVSRWHLVLLKERASLCSISGKKWETEMLPNTLRIVPPSGTRALMFSAVARIRSQASVAPTSKAFAPRPRS